MKKPQKTATKLIKNKIKRPEKCSRISIITFISYVFEKDSLENQKSRNV